MAGNKKSRDETSDAPIPSPPVTSCEKWPNRSSRDQMFLNRACHSLTYSLITICYCVIDTVVFNNKRRLRRYKNQPDQLPSRLFLRILETLTQTWRNINMAEELLACTLTRGRPASSTAQALQTGSPSAFLGTPFPSWCCWSTFWEADFLANSRAQVPHNEQRFRVEYLGNKTIYSRSWPTCLKICQQLFAIFIILVSSSHFYNISEHLSILGRRAQQAWRFMSYESLTLVLEGIRR